MKERLTELKGEIDSSIIIVEDFMIPLSITGRTIRQKNSEEIEVLNSSTNQLDLKDMRNTPPNKNRTYSSQMHMEHFFRIDHMIGHQTS